MDERKLSSSQTSSQVQPKRFPTLRQERAVSLGADELQQRIEWVLRSRPRALNNARRRYRAFCSSLLRALQKNYQRQALEPAA
jgi:hypothetical protein